MTDFSLFAVFIVQPDPALQSGRDGLLSQVAAAGAAGADDSSPVASSVGPPVTPAVPAAGVGADDASVENSTDAGTGLEGVEALSAEIADLVATVEDAGAAAQPGAQQTNLVPNSDIQ